MITVIHNPRCTKSRQAKDYLEEKGIPFEVREYLKDSLTEQELKEIIKKLNITPLELVRKNEKVWKENYKDKTLTPKELIKIMIENPKLIERPIIIKDDKAVIGRPTEAIQQIL